MAGTFIVHVLVLQSALIGARTTKIRPPETQGLGATSNKAERVTADTLVLVEISTPTANDRPLLEELGSAGSAPKHMMLSLLDPDPLPYVEIPPELLNEDGDAADAVNRGDQSLRAELFGRYTGQIAARIQRAWERPRTGVNPAQSRAQNAATPPSVTPVSDYFHCQVRIIQDRTGIVQEVQVLVCNGTVAWQHSLIQAILQSSPLPVPPTPKVFTSALTMSFTGYPDGSTLPSSAYEPEQSASSGTSPTGSNPLKW
jgi:hypothetical protein